MRYMRKFILTIFCFLIIGPLSNVLKAQGTVTTVRGQVIDSEDKQPVIGASVIEIDKDGRTVQGVTTDISGNYSLKILNPNDRIAISFIGYNTYREAINKRSVINVQLRPSTQQLGEVAIVGKRVINNGTGLNIDARNSTTATATIQAKDLEELSSASIDQALAGRLPGVDVSATSGDPGAGMSIRIRGTSSINGSSNPLIILDGLPFDTDVPSDFNFGTADENGYAQLLNIAPTDIKEITVLKDAAATAVWGSRAANGVLIINTKRGIMGKPQFTYNFKGSYAKQPKGIPLLSGDQYATLIPEEVSNGGGNPLDIQVNKEFSFDPYDPYWYYNYSNNTNWIDAVTQTGYSQDHNVSMTGGGEKARYYASVGYFGQKGTTVGTDLKRMTAKVNLDYNVSTRIRFRSDITFTHLDNNLNYTNGIRGVAFNKMPNMSVFQFDESGVESPVYLSPSTNIQGSYGSTYNPVAMATQAVSAQVGNRVIPHFNLQYDILPSLLVSQFDIGFDINNSKQNTFLPQVATGRPNTETVVNRAGDSDGDVFGVTSKLNFVFTPRLKNETNTFQGLLSLQSTDKKHVSYNASTANTASSLLQDVADPSRTANSDLALTASQGEYRSASALLQGQYSLFDKYIINAGLRADGSSRFGPANRYGLFPSVSVRWRASGESFMKNIKYIDDLSLRASYGQSGGEPSRDYSYFNQYSPYSYSYQGMAGVFPANMELSDLQWQTVTGTNIGFNLWMFKHRIMFDGEIYRNRTSKMLFNGLAIPSFTGFKSYSTNVGTMDNQGWEIGINTIPVKTRNFTMGFDFNIAKNINIMREVSDYFPRDNGVVVNRNGVYKSYLIVGNPFGSFYGFKYKGVYTDDDATIARDAAGTKIIGPNGQEIRMRFNYPSTDYTFEAGDAMYEDINHDGNIDDKDIVYLGNGIPKVNGGFGPNFTWKGAWKLTAFFNYKLGYQLINNASMTTSNMYSYDNQSTVVLRRWRNPGDVTDVPRALYRRGFNWLGSDRYVEDASFVRLQAVTLRYNFSKSLLNKIGVRNASFYITGENLYTWTKYKGQDPDVSTRGNNNPFTINYDRSLTPPSRNILMGITAGF